MGIDGIQPPSHRPVETSSPIQKELPKKGQDNKKGGKEQAQGGEEPFAKVLAGKTRGGFHKVL